MSKPTGFHVRHDLQPELTHELLLLIHKLAEETPTRERLHEAAKARGFKLSDRKDYGKLLKSLAELDLLDSHREPLTLSETGKIVATMTEYYQHLLADFVHFLYYAGFDGDSNKRFSWSYRLVCDYLWHAAPCSVDRHNLVNLVTEAAHQTFDLSGISFSTSSVVGILNWIDALQPACLQPGTSLVVFSRRSHCSVELFALALNHVYQHTDEDNLYLVLSPQIREQVCRICLLSPETFDEMLAETEAYIPKLQIRRERGARFRMADFSWADVAVEGMVA